MARCLDAAIVARPDIRTIVLTGNYHARIGVGAPWDKTLEFTGYRLRQHDPVAINLAATEGSAWVCIPECGRMQLEKGKITTATQFQMEDHLDARGYHGEVRFPSFQASPPAMGEGEVPTPAPAPEA